MLFNAPLQPSFEPTLGNWKGLQGLCNKMICTLCPASALQPSTSPCPEKPPNTDVVISSQSLQPLQSFGVPSLLLLHESLLFKLQHLPNLPSIMDVLIPAPGNFNHHGGRPLRTGGIQQVLLSRDCQFLQPLWVWVPNTSRNAQVCYTQLPYSVSCNVVPHPSGIMDNSGNTGVHAILPGHLSCDLAFILIHSFHNCHCSIFSRVEREISVAHTLSPERSHPVCSRFFPNGWVTLTLLLIMASTLVPTSKTSFLKIFPVVFVWPMLLLCFLRTLTKCNYFLILFLIVSPKLFFPLLAFPELSSFLFLISPSHLNGFNLKQASVKGLEINAESLAPIYFCLALCKKRNVLEASGI